MKVARSLRLLVAGFVVFTLVAAGKTNAKYDFLHEAITAPASSIYDYIVIGGGTTGCPLAATLSQNASVLVLERGGSPYENPNVTNLRYIANSFSDTKPTSPAQHFVSTDGVLNVRPRCLGGGSCINGGLYTRADPEFIKRGGLDSDAVKEAYEWVEKKVAHLTPVKQWQSAFRDSLLELDISPYNGMTYDHQSGTKITATIFDEQGHRHTAADLLEYADPDKITVLLHATVHRILFSEQGEDKPIKAHGVEFMDASGEMHTALLNEGIENEIVLSAGALGSPQLLMLSGYGPASQLEARNISVVMDNPMVGQNMMDNPMNIILVPSPVPVEITPLQTVGIVTDSDVYIEGCSGTGLYTIPGLNTRSSSDGATSQDGFILTKVANPISTGHLELQTLNPDDNPSVTFNYFSEPEDLQKCVAGMKILTNILESKAFSAYKYENMSTQMLLDLNNKNVSTRTLEQYCKDTVKTIWHYHGGCCVGQVVDINHKVYGVDSLRVADGSVYIHSPGTNPQATCMMQGRFIGLKMLEDRFAIRTKQR